MAKILTLTVGTSKVVVSRDKNTVSLQAGANKWDRPSLVQALESVDRDWAALPIQFHDNSVKAEVEKLKTPAVVAPAEAPATE